MSLNETPSAERLHIGFFGLRNAGKSSLVNAITGQSLSVVSAVKGTTTDPVKKAMELGALGPVVIVDTPGLDDEGELGALRVEKARQILAKIHIAVLVVDATQGLSNADQALIDQLQERSLPYLIAYNKSDLLPDRPTLPDRCLYVSAQTGEGIRELKEALGRFSKPAPKVPVSDLVAPGDLVVLVTPIDGSAPKGRLILPQQLILRDLIDHHCIALTCQPEEVKAVLSTVTPALVITDSQVFQQVSADVPEHIPLTSFSILMARYKGDLPALIRGADALSHLKDGDRVLICEGCTHHRQCGDIGTVKLPQWIRDFSGAQPQFSFTSGGDYPADLSDYALIVHCGGCMLTEQEMRHRITAAGHIPIVNYGIAIAHMTGILRRSLAPLS